MTSPAADARNALAIPTGWTRSDDGDRIVRDLRLRDFMSAIGLVNEIAMLAESLDHHPDMTVHGWNRLHLESTSHDVGTLTERDVRLAEHINRLIAERGIETPAR